MIKLKRFILDWLYELRMRKSLTQKFKLREIQDIVRKCEEFKYKLLQAKSSGAKEESNYQAYVKALKWVLNDDSEN